MFYNRAGLGLRITEW